MRQPLALIADVIVVVLVIAPAASLSRSIKPYILTRLYRHLKKRYRKDEVILKKSNLIKNCKYVISIAEGEAKFYILAKLFFVLLNGVSPLLFILFPKLIIDVLQTGKAGMA